VIVEALKSRLLSSISLEEQIDYRLTNFVNIVEPYDRVSRYRHLAFASYRLKQMEYERIRLAPNV
jgi:hypothetical protein